MNIFDQAKILQIRRLKEAQEKLEQFSVPTSLSRISFNTTELTTQTAIEQLAGPIPKHGRFIYYFYSEDAQSIVDSFQNDPDPNYKRSRFNTNHEISPHLYVGSSKSLQKRFKEHCGICNKATYALKFQNWIKDHPIQLEFHYCEILTDDQEILQNLEDGLWLRLKPVFGKYGGKY